jgi:predicted nucleotidyltransferase
MTGSERVHTDDANVLEGVEAVLSRHPVRFALVFGSVARDTANERSDIDVAIEFERLRPGDTGYSDAYLRLLSEVDTAVSADVDLVDVHTMGPRFAKAVFDTGQILVGSEERRDELERELAGELLSIEEARERVSDAVARLQ